MSGLGPCAVAVSLATAFALWSGLLPVRPERSPASPEERRSAVGPPAVVEAGRRPPVVFCFAPGTPDDVVRRHHELTQPTGLEPMFYTSANRWSGTIGSPRALTWSFIPDGVTVDDQPNELFSRMDALFASQGGRARWISLFEACFDRWATLTGTSYTRITTGGNDWDDGAAFGSFGGTGRGDIRIAMIVQDGASKVLAYNYYPTNSSGRGGDMVLDRAENWASTSNNFRFFRNIVMHEHGHGLGLAHVCPTGQTRLMEPFLSTSFDGPQHDDIRGGQKLYGDPSEDNNTSATARVLGLLEAGSPMVIGAPPAPSVNHGALLSIDENGEVDWFRFTLSGPRAVTCTVTPVGLTYDSSTQNSDSSCNSGNNVNSLAAANLNFEIRAANGTTVLATAAAQPAGVAETVVNLMLTAGGDYYVRVYEGDNPTSPQLYHLSLSAANVDCNANGVPDLTDIASGTSKDCNLNQLPDECEATSATDLDGDGNLDICEYRRGDFDLDGDTDQADFGVMQACLAAPGVQVSPACVKARLNAGDSVDEFDMAIFINCMSGPGIPYNPSCNGL